MPTPLPARTGAEHYAEVLLTPAVRARFEAQIEPIPGIECRLWSGSIGKRRYGYFRVGGRLLRANRVAWMLARGPIPEGLFVLHRCDVPACVNIDHLFLGTQADNVADQVRKGRVARGAARRAARGDAHYTRRHPEWITRGERVGSAKLTAAQVAEIRAAGRDVSHAALARHYHVAPDTIACVRQGRTWAAPSTERR